MENQKPNHTHEARINGQLVEKEVSELNDRFKNKYKEELLVICTNQGSVDYSITFSEESLSYAISRVLRCAPELIPAFEFAVNYAKKTP